jgi:hypothetical protein
MAKRRKKHSKKPTKLSVHAPRNGTSKALRNTPALVPDTIFWPDRVDHIKAIALRGYSDAEMAAVLGVSEQLLDSWKAYYPNFAKAIDEGRTHADAQVVAALHANAIGYERDVDEVVRTRKGAQVVTVSKYYPGDTSAQKFWLQNRQKEHWNAAQNVAIGGRGKDNPIHIDQETKAMVIHSILNLITPRPDNA